MEIVEKCKDEVDYIVDRDSIALDSCKTLLPNILFSKIPKKDLFCALFLVKFDTLVFTRVFLKSGK